MWNARLDEAQAGIKIAGRNIKKVKEGSEKVGLKLNIQKTKITASGPITSWQVDGETMRDFLFLGSKTTAGWWWWQPWN